MTTDERNKPDAGLSEVATKLAGHGFMVVGGAQNNTVRSDCRGCDTDLSVLQIRRYDLRQFEIVSLM